MLINNVFWYAGGRVDGYKAIYSSNSSCGELCLDCLLGFMLLFLQAFEMIDFFYIIPSQVTATCAALTMRFAGIYDTHTTMLFYMTLVTRCSVLS